MIRSYSPFISAVDPLPGFTVTEGVVYVHGVTVGIRKGDFLELGQDPPCWSLIGVVGK